MVKTFDKEGKNENTSSQKNNSENHNNEKKSKNNTEDNLGEFPKFSHRIYYDSQKKIFQVLDRRGNVITETKCITADGLNAYQLWCKEQKPGTNTSYSAFEETFKGKDGKDAYQLWRDSQPEDTDCSETAYRKYLKGENGKSAFEQWKEVHGEYANPTEDDFFEFLKGKDGSQWTINKDGYWCCDGVPTSKIAIPEKGKSGDDGQSAFEAWQSLDFENRKYSSLTDFFNWMVEQTEKKIDAKEGATWIPNIVDGKVIFTNNRNGAATDAYPVKGKDGKSYTPVFVEGKLVFIDDEGREATPRHDYRGKSAFDLWQEQPCNEGKTLADFFIFLKGEKGDAGLDGMVREAKHSYLEIKDFTCPVQTIDTALISNSSDSAKSPENIVNEKIEEIEQKRADGSKVLEGKSEQNAWFFNGNWIYKNWAGWFKEFSWWCAGADRPLLRMCPGDHSKYTGIGTVILFTALMAWFSSYIAMRLVFKVPENASIWDGGSNLAALGFAFFWAMMIFFLDRFITNTMYSDGEVTICKKELVSGLPRILIAIFLGIVISAPLELRIFDQEIKKEIKDIRKAELEADKNKATKDLNHFIDSLQTVIGKRKDNLQSLKSKIGERDKLNSIIDLKEKGADPRPKQVREKKPNETQKQYDEYTKSVSNANNINQEINNKNKENSTSKYESKKDTIQKEIDYLTSNIDTTSLSNRISDLKKKVSSYNKIYDPKIKESNLNKYASNAGLQTNLHAMHSIAMKDYEGWKWTGGKDTNKNGKIDYEEESFWGHALHSWIAFLLFTPIGLIMLLFILIDISPVLYKMMLADGVYDNYLHQEKLLKQDKIRLSLSRMLRKLDKGELKALSPFIMGKMYRKLSKFSVDEKSLSEKDYKHSINWGENIDELDQRIEEENKKVFEIILQYKKRIIQASYAAWYRDMRDAFIGSPNDGDSDDGGISPEEILTKDPNFDQEHSETKSETEAKKGEESQESSNKEEEESHEQEGTSNENSGETHQSDNDGKLDEADQDSNNTNSNSKNDDSMDDFDYEEIM